MACDEIPDELNIPLIEQRLEIDGVEIAALLGEISTLVKNVGDTTAHASSKIPAAGAKHQHQAVRHVLAAVVANALDDGGRARIADSKALAGDSVEECFAARGAVKGDVADDDV